MSSDPNSFIYKLNTSAVLTVIGIILLFSGAIGVTLIAPRYLDKSWTTPSSDYQVQMYEIADPNIYISTSKTSTKDLQVVHHLKKNFTLLAFHESEVLRIVTAPELEKYVTRYGSPVLLLTSDLLMLRRPVVSPTFDAVAAAKILQDRLQMGWEASHVGWRDQNLQKPRFEIWELYVAPAQEAFALSDTDGIIENWVDENYTILDEQARQHYHSMSGVVYVNNPREYRVSHYAFGTEHGWVIDPMGESIKTPQDLKDRLGFMSRQELIYLGEEMYANEGCFNCHTDQTRTLVQDVVLNGSETFPAPPSSANEYIYQKKTYPGTQRIGPDMSRVGVKRPSRDWHKGHFWSPKTASAGTIMPAFRHFFDDDPRGTNKSPVGVPNYKFEAMYQYLMTKGTRITAPTQAWWLGKDPIRTIDIIEGRVVAK